MECDQVKSVIYNQYNNIFIIISSHELCILSAALRLWQVLSSK